MFSVSPFIATALVRPVDASRRPGLPSLAWDSWTSNPRRFCVVLVALVVGLAVAVALAMISVGLMLGVGIVLLLSLTGISLGVEEENRASWQQGLLDAWVGVLDGFDDDDWGGWDD